MTPEQLTDQIRAVMPKGLRSVILFGSAAAGDHLREQSDYNILVVFDRLDLQELKALAEPTRKWVKQGNPTPLLFTVDTLRDSGDVFSIELLDIRDAHKILFGENVLPEISVSQADLRRQIERELKGKRLHLQSQVILTGMKPKQLVELMTSSLANFLILFRATLRLYRPENVPVKKLEAAQALAQFIPFDQEALVAIHELKEGLKSLRDIDPDALFVRYLGAIDLVTKAVNDFEKRS